MGALKTSFIVLRRGMSAVGGLLVILLFFSVISAALLRYGFSAGFVQLYDFQHYVFGCLVLFSIVYAFWKDRHVRVELAPIKDRTFRRLWLLSLVCFPVLYIGLLAYPEVAFSWKNFEGSAEPGGLGGLFLLKTLLPISCFVIVLIGIRKILKTES
ncbi:MAG: TRAP transporter small permease subunit [Pseudomonadota bacterium]